MVDNSYYPYPPSAGSNYSYEGEQEFERIQNHLRSLHERKQRLLLNLQSNPYQRHEIESQLRQNEREIQHYQQQLGPGMDQHPYPAYGPPKGNPFGVMSPVDSAIGSGVTSGVTTNAPSAVADGDLEDFKDEEPGSAGFPPYQPPPFPEQQARATNDHMLQSRPDRIRMTMFPETIQEGDEIPSTQMMSNQQTNLQRLAQPAQILKSALSSLATYQSSTELTAQMLPDVVKLLTLPEESTVLEASKLLMELSKKEASCRAIIANGQVLNMIIQAMAGTGNPEIQKNLSGVLHHCSNDHQGLLTIYNCGGIPYLVRLLASPVDAVLFYAITTLHNMLLHYEPAKMDVRIAGGLEKMVGLLMKDNPKFLAITADCLHILAYGHQESKLIILASGGPALLVRIMRLYTYEKLLWTCSRLLKVLSVCPSNKPEIVQAGGMQALSTHLSHRSTRLVQNILFTIRNLSDAATKQDHLDDLLRQLIMLLSSNDVTIVNCSVGVLSNLTCNNAKNKTIVCQLHGVEALLRVITSAGGREEIIDAAVCTLRHITSRHPNAEMSQNAVRQQNGIPLIVGFLQQQCRWQLMKSLLGLIRNLALCNENHAVLRSSGVIPKIWQLLNRAHQESSRRTMPGAPAGYIDGVYMDEIVDMCVGSLHLMARDPNNRIVLKQLNSIPLFIQLLYSPTENITRVAAGVLCELAQDPDGAAQIERENGTQPLTELLNSRNEAIAAYAASVLFCLSEDGRKSAQTATIFRNESAMMTNGHSTGNQIGYYGGGPPQPMAMSHMSSNPASHPASGYGTPHIHSNSASGYTTPHDVSGLLTPDLDLPLDFGALDDLDNIGGFPPTTTQPPPTVTPHTHHYTPQQQQQYPPQHHQPSLHPQMHSNGGYPYHSSYNPPSPAVMDTAQPWMDSDL